MGAIGSRVEIVDEEGTPAKCRISHRQLEDDPRSPTNNIPRTPIMVDKTPNGELDPRSPTPGIWRTPISNLVLKKDDAVTKAEDSAPLLDESGSPEPAQKASEDDQLHRLLDQQDKPSDSTSTELQQLSSLSLSDVDESSSLLNKTEKVQKKPKTQKAQPKKLFYDKKVKSMHAVTRSGFSSVNTPPRSPLSTVVIDTNSPRVIVQRKQTKKIDAARHCRLDARSAQDKENVDM